MLADSQIQKALRDRDVSVGYAFVPNADGVWVHQDPLADAFDDPDGQAVFNSLRVKSRVGLTTGPLLKPLDYSLRVARDLRFEGHDGVVDLRSGAGYRLGPGQSALVLTNELIDLSHRVGALVLGRVSSYSDGLVVSASYLDPTWSGLIKLHIHNSSNRPVLIRLGMEIGRLFLFDTAQSTPDPLAVAHQGLHYGYSWRRIFDDGIDPFPERAPVEQRRQIRDRLKWINATLKHNLGYTAAGALVLLAVPALRLYQEVDNWSERFDQLDQIEGDVNDLASAQPRTGLETLTWNDGALVTETDVVVPDVNYNPGQTFSAAMAAVPQLGSDPTTNIRVITSVARIGGQTVLTIRAERSDGDPLQNIDVRWLIVP